MAGAKSLSGKVVMEKWQSLSTLRSSWTHLTELKFDLYERSGPSLIWFPHWSINSLIPHLSREKSHIWFTCSAVYGINSLLAWLPLSYIQAETTANRLKWVNDVHRCPHGLSLTPLFLTLAIAMVQQFWLFFHRSARPEFSSKPQSALARPY